MILQPVVEGPGDESAVPVLLRRLLVEVIGCNYSRVAWPYKLPHSQMTQEHRCKHHLTISQLDTSVDHVLLFMDSDDDCCRDLHAQITAWGRDVIYRTRFDVICIEREYEAWLLAGITSLRGIHGISDVAVPPHNLNRIRDAKGRITALMPHGVTYSETADQASLTAAVDLASVSASSTSFSRLVTKLEVAHASTCRQCSYVSP